MWEKDYYKRFLSEDQLEEVRKVIEDDRDNIYKSSDSKIQSTLNRIYETVIIETAIRFKDREYFSNEKFEDFIRDAGYDVPKLDKEVGILKSFVAEFLRKLNYQKRKLR